MDKQKLEELRDYYDNTDTADEIGDADLDTEIIESPMVGITVRLPQHLLQSVREAAAQEGIKTTALIRRWIEDQMRPKKEFTAETGHFAFADVVSISTNWSNVTVLHPNARPAAEEIAVARALARAL